MVATAHFHGRLRGYRGADLGSRHLQGFHRLRALWWTGLRCLTPRSDARPDNSDAAMTGGSPTTLPIPAMHRPGSRPDRSLMAWADSTAHCTTKPDLRSRAPSRLEALGAGEGVSGAVPTTLVIQGDRMTTPNQGSGCESDPTLVETTREDRRFGTYEASVLTKARPKICRSTR